MAKVKLSRPQEEIIDLLAHFAAISEIEGADPRLNGMFNDYKASLPAKQQAIWKHFKERCLTVRNNLAEEMAKEINSA